MQAGEQQAQAQGQQAAPIGTSNIWHLSLRTTHAFCFADTGLLVAASLVLWVVCARHRRQRQEAALYRKSQPPSGTRGAGSSKNLLLPGSSTNSGKGDHPSDGEDGG